MDGESGKSVARRRNRRIGDRLVRGCRLPCKITQNGIKWDMAAMTRFVAKELRIYSKTANSTT